MRERKENAGHENPSKSDYFVHGAKYNQGLRVLRWFLSVG